MRRRFVDPRDETPALRRAAILLERATEDCGDAACELMAVLEGIAAMRDAAADGQLVDWSTVERLDAAIAPIEDDVADDLVRLNALEETRELLLRLGVHRPQPSRA